MDNEAYEYAEEYCIRRSRDKNVFDGFYSTWYIHTSTWIELERKMLSVCSFLPFLWGKPTSSPYSFFFGESKRVSNTA